MREIQYEYDNNFEGMTAQNVPIEALLDTRERLLAEIQGGRRGDGQCGEGNASAGLWAGAGLRGKLLRCCGRTG